MTAELVDAAVIGGGLAGCSAAIHLARQGARVALLEAKTYPHHKVCGEVLSPECAPLLEELELGAWLRARRPAQIDRVELTAPGGIGWESPLPGSAIGVSRYALDHALADRAADCQVDLRAGATVTSIRGSLSERFHLTIRSPAGGSVLTARVVIAAHGKRSALDRAMNRAFLRRPQPFVGLKAHFYGPPLPRRTELHAFPGGYCGLSEIEDGKTNACILVRDEVFRQAGGVDAFIAWMKQQNDRLGAWFAVATPAGERWYSIGQIPFVAKSVVESGVLMAGDSAGLIAPLTGSGMAMALRGGKLAAGYASAYLSGQISDDRLCSQYAAAWQREFRPQLRLGHLLQAFVLRPAHLAAGLRLVNTVPPLGRYLISHTRDISVNGS